ncbi:MAG: flagellar motor stator protein MotA [Alphaproteobacteria bacterium]
MLGIIAILVTFGTVFGGFVGEGGKLAIIIHALPFESVMLLGATFGAFLLANKGDVIKGVGRNIKKVFKGPKWKGDDYKDLLCLLFGLLKLIRTKGMIVIEQHIEKPEESGIFQQYPRILHDHFAVEFICDTLRMMTMNFEDPHQVENMMDGQLEKHHHELHQFSHAIQTVADGVPAIGIVVAVLGVIKTMGSINAPVEILGEMIGGALTGTFLGVFFAYTLFGPMSSKMGQCFDQEHQFYMIIRAVLVSHLYGNAPQVSVEIGRGNIPTIYQPSFIEMEEKLQTISFA